MVSAEARIVDGSIVMELKDKLLKPAALRRKLLIRLAVIKSVNTYEIVTYRW